MVKDPIEDRRRDHMILENFTPLAIRLIGCEYRGDAFISSGNELKEAMGTMIIERKIPHLIDDQQLKLRQPANFLFELLFPVCLSKPLDPCGSHEEISLHESHSVLDLAFRLGTVRTAETGYKPVMGKEVFEL